MEKEFRRAVIMGCACVITSRFTVEELESFRNYLPDALVLKNDEDEEIYRIGLEEEFNGGKILDDLTSYSKTKAPGGKATVTVLIDPEDDDKAEAIRIAFGAALLRLEELEEQMLSRLEELKEKIGEIDGLICRP